MSKRTCGTGEGIYWQRGNKTAEVSESTETTLLSCPFCGGKPKAYWDTEDETEGYNLICCNGLHISTVFKSEALEAWNTRVR